MGRPDSDTDRVADRDEQWAPASEFRLILNTPPSRVGLNLVGGRFCSTKDCTNCFEAQREIFLGTNSGTASTFNSLMERQVVAIQVGTLAASQF